MITTEQWNGLRIDDVIVEKSGRLRYVIDWMKPLQGNATNMILVYGMRTDSHSAWAGYSGLKNYLIGRWRPKPN